MKVIAQTARSRRAKEQGLSFVSIPVSRDRAQWGTRSQGYIEGMVDRAGTVHVWDSASKSYTAEHTLTEAEQEMARQSVRPFTG